MHREDEDAVLAGGVDVVVFTRMPGGSERLRFGLCCWVYGTSCQPNYQYNSHFKS